MRYTAIVRRRSPSHVSFGFFVNGGLAGELTLRTEEFADMVVRLEAAVVDNISVTMVLGEDLPVKGDHD